MALLTGVQSFPPSFDHLCIRPDADRGPWIAEGGEPSDFRGPLIGPRAPALVLGREAPSATGKAAVDDGGGVLNSYATTSGG